MSDRSRHPLYNVWRSMLARCENPKNPSFKDYGGRGITVCAAWHDFASFCKDVEPFPGKGYSIDRINNNGNYESSNVRWSQALEQARNRRNTKMVTYEGQTKCLSEWAKEKNLSHATLRHRIFTMEWLVEEAFLLPPGAKPTTKKIVERTTNVVHDGGTDQPTENSLNMTHTPPAIQAKPIDDGYYIRLSAEDKEFLLKMGGARWIRACIELARKGETK